MTNILRNAAAIAAFFVVPAGFAAAESQITLRSASGGLVLSGDLAGYDGRYVRLRTDYGEVTLDYTGLTCEGATCPDPASYAPELRIAGDGAALTRLLPPMMAAYGRAKGWRLRSDGNQHALWRDGAETPELTLTLLGRVYPDVVTELSEGTADVVLTSDALTASDRQRGLEAGLGDLRRGAATRILALDAIVPIVAPGRELEDIHLRTLTEIISGRAQDWSVLGHSPEPLLAMIPQDPFLPLPGPPAGLVRVEENLVAGAVAQDSAALGLVGFGRSGNARPLAVSGPCGRPIRATVASLKTGDYPLTRPVFLYRPARRLPVPAQDFLIWLRSREAQGVIRRAGYVDLGADRVALSEQGERLAGAIEAAGAEVGLGELQRMVRILSGHDRLTPTFRFDDGSTRLSAQSRSYLLQLARGLREGLYDGDELMLVGFSDGRGPALVNRDLSRARAEAVRRSLIQALGGALPEAVTITTEAFGETLPIACDEVPWGQNANRRVELWIARRGG